MVERGYLIALVLVLLAFAVTGCGGEKSREAAREALHEGAHVVAAGSVAQMGPGSIVVEAPPAGMVTFALRSALVDGRMAFVGVGGAIDGRINPTLSVPAGGRVRLTIQNGDGMLHDLAVPGLGAKSGSLNRKGASTEVTFDVGDKAGAYEYYCTVAGHRQAGMVGTLVVE